MADFAPTLDDINAKAEEAVRAHEKAFGYKPSPGLLLNVLKAPIKPEQYPALFDSVSGGRRKQRALTSNQSVLGPNYTATDTPPDLSEPATPITAEDVTGTVTQTLDKMTSFFGGTIPKSTRDQAEQIAAKWREGALSYGDLWEMTKDDPGLQGRVNRLIKASMPGSVDPPIPVLPGPVSPDAALVPLAEGTPARDAEKEQEQYRKALEWSLTNYGDLTREDLEQQGVYVSKGILRGFEQTTDFVASGIFGVNRDNLLARTAYEIGLAGTQMPFGMYAIGLTVGRDVKDLVLEGDVTPERTWDLTKQAVYGTWNDLQHPLEHPGFFLLSAMSVAGSVAGVGARVGNTAARVGKASGVLGTTRAVAGGIVFRPLPGQAVVAGEVVGLTENAAIRSLQRLYYGAADRAISRRTGPNGTPYGQTPISKGVTSTPGIAALDRVRRRFFSFEETYSRAVHRRLRAEIAEATFRADRVMRIANGAAKAEKQFDRLLENAAWGGWFRKQTKKTQVGVQKAMQVIASDVDQDPLTALQIHREFHQSILTDPELAASWAEKHGVSVLHVQQSHKAQLLALDEAEKVLMSMDDSFVNTFLETKALADLTENIRKGLGLDEFTAAQRLGRYGRLISGDEVSWIPDPHGLIQAEIDRLNATIANRGGMARAGKADDLIKRQTARLEAVEKKLATAQDEEQVARLAAQRDRIRASIEKNTDKATRGQTPTVPEINRGKMGETGAGETISRVERLQDALNDPRLDTDPEIVLRELGLEAPTEPLLTDPVNPLVSFFFSSKRALKGKPVSAYTGPTQSPYGMGPPSLRRDLPELFHRFDGDSIMVGDFRIDVSGLTTEGYKSTVRAVTRRDNWERLWQLSTDKPGPHSFLIRDIDAADIKDDIRGLFKKMDEGTWTEAEAAFDKNDQMLLSTLFPGRVVGGKLVDLEGKPLQLPPGSFRYVDERFVMDTPGMQNPFLAQLDRVLSGEGEGIGAKTVGTVLQGYNEVARSMTLFLRTKYALNALSSAALLMITDGPLAPVHLGMALTSKVRYGDDAARWLDGLAGQSRTQSLVSSKAPITVASRKLSEAWTVITDRFFRRAAVIQELRRQGIRGPEAIREAMTSTDPAVLRKVREASTRAKRAMVEFDNLNPFEQAVMRHVLFIYPWVRGSAVWSLRFLVDHPNQAEAFRQVGSMKEEEFEKLLGQVPGLWKRMQMFITGEDENGDLTASPTAFLAPTSAWHDMARPWASLFQGENPGRVALGESFGPQGALGVRLATNRDQYGREYEGMPVVGALKEQFADTALGAFFGKKERLANQEPLPEIDPTRRDTLVTRESAASKRPIQKLISNEQILDSFLNPFFEPTIDKEALNARGWMDVARSDREAWHKHQMDLIKQGLELQAKVVGDPVPLDVRTAAAFVDEWSWQNTEARRELGPPAVTARERAMRALPILVDLGVYTTEEAAAKRQRLEETLDGPEMKRLLASITDDAGGRALEEWNQSVRTVVQFRDTNQLLEITEGLKGIGAGDYAGILTSTQEQRDEYGRGMVAFMSEYNRRIDEYEDPSLPQEEQSTLQREFRDWLAENDQPVKIGGKEFPSYEAARWGLQGPEARRTDVVQAANRPVENLSSFDRVLLGLPDRDPRQMVEAWQAFEEQVARDKAQLDSPAFDGKKKPTLRSIELNRAEWIDGAIPGFKDEFLVASGPKVRWLEKLRQFKESQFREEWGDLFALAGQYATMIEDKQRRLDNNETGGVPMGSVRTGWDRYVKDFYGMLPADFQAEVNDYGGLDWLASWL